MRWFRLNNLEESIKTMREIMAIGQRPVFYYKNVLHMCVRTPVPWAYVGEILEEMSKDGIELEECGYTALVKMHMSEGDHSAALALLEKMVSIPSAMPKRRTLLPVLQGCAKNGDLVAMRKIIDIYNRVAVSLQSEEFAALVFVCTMHGDRKSMAMVLDDM
jgi:hypothetical protein